jgi:hypothetical protein
MFKPVDGFGVAGEYNGNTRCGGNHTNPVESMETGSSSGDAHGQTPQKAHGPFALYMSFL